MRVVKVQERERKGVRGRKGMREGVLHLLMSRPHTHAHLEMSEMR